MLHFHKMHGAGNDFVLLDLRREPVRVDALLAQRLADRRHGVGCDQLLLLQSAQSGPATARYEIRNADGSVAGQCGNGVRCLALYLRLFDQPGAERFVLEGPAGLVEVSHCADGEFEASMGAPSFDPGRIPIALASEDGRFELDSPWGPLEFTAASMGNPHALLQVKDIDAAAVTTIGPWLGRHEVFPEGCNVGFAQVLDRGSIRLRVFERGCGETLACGSGASAAVAMLRRLGLVDNPVRVFLPGGLLVISWPGNRQSLRMKGPATYVFSGTMSHE